jgi:hypothetical protein
LHRSPEEPVNNASLIAALLAEQDRYADETHVVPKPDAIVVNNDLDTKHLGGQEFDLSQELAD